MAKLTFKDLKRIKKTFMRAFQLSDEQREKFISEVFLTHFYEENIFLTKRFLVKN